jgi:hypothetical protein
MGHRILPATHPSDDHDQKDAVGMLQDSGEPAPIDLCAFSRRAGEIIAREVSRPAQHRTKASSRSLR